MTVPDPHSPSPAPPPTRRALRERTVAEPDHPPIFKAPPPPRRLAPLLEGRPGARRALPVRHARRPRPGVGARFALAAATALVLATGSAASAIALTGSAPVAAPAADVSAPSPLAPQVRVTVTGTAPGAPIVGDVGAELLPSVLALCDTPAFTNALAAHDDAAAIREAGGGAQFRAAVIGGQAPCVSLDDPTRLWVVVDKLRPITPLDYAPAPLATPDPSTGLSAASLRADAADAFTAMATAARAAGAGTVVAASGYRSFLTQQAAYASYVRTDGQTAADLESARPGYSEHQLGLAADTAPCSPGCGTLDDLASSPQGAWILAHSWEYGWIVRYEGGKTPVTGYGSEPWHLRYIGVDLATAYHDGGFHSLEEFFALPAAPGYAG